MRSLLVALLLVGCDGGGASSVHLLGAWDMPPETRGSAAGFDLDGLASTGEGTSCVDVAPDYVSPFSGEAGVDNARAALILHDHPDAIRDDLAAHVASGAMLYAIEVERAGTHAEVIVHRASVEGGVHVEQGLPIPDQRVDVEPLASGSGSIEGRVVRARLEPFAIALASGEHLITVTLGSPIIRFELADDGSIARGELGGSIEIEELAVRAEELRAGYGDLVRTAIAGDLDPDPADPAICRRLSLAYTFEGVPAAR